MKLSQEYKQFRGFLLLTFLSFWLSACGGDGGNPKPKVLTGVFIDAAVAGIQFKTKTQTGLSDSNGTFRYIAGETVSFYIGSVLLGSATGDARITPLNLVANAVDESNQQVTNILRFLQSLDGDADLTNGIDISAATHTAFNDQSLDFSLSSNAFETAFTAISSALLNNLNLVSVSAAREHFRGVLDAIINESKGNGGYGFLSVAGKDTSVLGLRHDPDFVSLSTTQDIMSVTWLGGDSASLTFTTSNNQVMSVVFILTKLTLGNDLSIISEGIYTYNISCLFATSASCKDVSFDLETKSLTLDNVILDAGRGAISGNLAAGPVTLNGTLFWE